MNVLFYDGVGPTAYVLSSLTTGGLGGTEASVLRIAHKLRTSGNKVTIQQRHREAPITDLNGLDYDPLDSNVPAQVVITLRDAGHYLANKKKWPTAKHYLWLHDVVAGDYRDHLIHHLNGQEAHLICVSDFHKTNIIEALRPILDQSRIGLTRIYLPLADYCVKADGQEYDKNKLIFISSPHKGLDWVLQVFKYSRNVDRSLRLYIANPGYYPMPDNLEAEGITVLGPLSHPETINHVRTSLCLFYPQFSFAETFGLVYAESDAVGTPVLGHPLGSAREVLYHPSELMDCKDYVKVIDRVLAWKSGERPIVRSKKEFLMPTVISEWLKLFNSR